ncbi:MAG: phage virion morphogenesis protein [Acidobacteria bacterium]|nr:phage virion morphogenesis protein [Acidobacteriota bacterium]
MLRVRIEFDSASPLLAALGRRLADADELLAPAVPVVAAAIERNFDEEGRPARWTPLSPRYARFKAQRFGPGLKILELTGRLRRFVRTRIEAGAIVVSSDLPYAPAHQFGVPARGLPARPFLVLTEADKQEAAQAIAASLPGTENQAPGTSPP